jgi:thiol-disulfide isomerase/thioredoxin
MRFVLAALLCLWGATAWADKKPDKKPDKKKAAPEEKGYHFVLTIHNSPDTVMYLGNYYVGKTYAIDTARRNKKGQFVFESKDVKLLPGLYFFSNPKGSYVEFMVYHEKPDFVFETDHPQWAEHIKVKGSKENELFYFYNGQKRRMTDLLDSVKKEGNDSVYKAVYRKCQDELVDIINAHPDNMLSVMINALREPEVPIHDSTGRKLSDRERYMYFIDHYFDHVALDNDVLVRTPEVFFYKKVMDYLDKNLKGASAEFIIEYVDKMIEKSRPSKEVFKYLVHTITEKYLQTNIMSYDAIYVHMVKKYYATGDNFWSSPSVIDEQVKRANTWERLLIGKQAPELILKDTEGRPRSMYQLPNKYTLLVFWSPTCGHCKVVIPELYAKYQEYKDKYDIAAFAILSEPDEPTRPKWHKFIKDHQLDWINLDGGEANIDWHEVYDVITTPQIYLLDKDKKILAKKLNAESFEMVIKALEGVE